MTSLSNKVLDMLLHAQQVIPHNDYICDVLLVLFNFINLTQVHNFTVSAQDIFTFRRLSVFTVSFTGIS